MSMDFLNAKNELMGWFPAGIWPPRMFCQHIVFNHTKPAITLSLHLYIRVEQLKLYNSKWNSKWNLRPEIQNRKASRRALNARNKLYAWFHVDLAYLNVFFRFLFTDLGSFKNGIFEKYKVKWPCVEQYACFFLNGQN